MITKTKLTENQKLAKIFPTVKMLWENVTDDNCCSYINSMVHALCGHYELYLFNEAVIDVVFIDYWMDLCNSNGLPLDQVEEFFMSTIEHFSNEDIKEDSCLLEQTY